MPLAGTAAAALDAPFPASPAGLVAAFQTGVPGEVIDQFEDEYVAVFIPTTPSPVNGFYFYVRKADTIELNISVDVALKSIISMGVVPPVGNTSSASNSK